MDKQELKLGARILENLPIMPPDVMQGWIDNPKALNKFLAGLVPEETPKTCLRHLETVTLAPTKGKATLAKAKKVFTGWLDGDLENWGTDVSGEDTTETAVDVHEMSRDGNYKTLFGSLGDPRKLCLTQGQIEEFCRSHRDSLRQEGYGTFFLFEVKGELFVADVSVGGGELEARVGRFGYDNVWVADDRHRLVVQKQTV
ncbi:MAG: hypothetical protein RLZZ230_664 [Candidatus Parcubacteria bacterium]|jgi:hypothetical protein